MLANVSRLASTGDSAKDCDSHESSLITLLPDVKLSFQALTRSPRILRVIAMSANLLPDFEDDFSEDETEDRNSEDSEDSEECEECEECEELIPDCGSLVNRHHDLSCSLHPRNVVFISPDE